MPAIFFTQPHPRKNRAQNAENLQYNSNIYLSQQYYLSNVFLKLASNSCKILRNMNLAKPIILNRCILVDLVT